MARNKLSDLSNHLFAQLERLEDESLTDEQMKKEVERSKAITSISSQLIKNAKVTIDAMKLIANGDIEIRELPDSFGFKKIGNGSLNDS